MKEENLIKEKTYNFALKIIELYKFLNFEKKEFVLSKQILRSGTSIGANVKEAQAAQSKKDFLSKLSIASKEARETFYWLRLLNDSGYIENYSSKDLLFREINSIINILTKIIKNINGEQK
ncbi:four helix bundle protein [Hippea maritima]|uniref:CHP02436-containing protein n=1 Tax=Hippea maritima (strain ATCC 700847 / DSM 10411 / MH2) TaxID=760142 RepID=F2LUY4_HIPMA|nr:four helix bundle protein [Hippea maritima]AEA34653.1 CHP02436-containing protein [Hippea maritima DSM 10411]